MIKLIDPNNDYVDQYKEAYELTSNLIKEGIIKNHNQMFIYADDDNLIERLINNRDQSKIPSHYVPAYYYFVIDDDKFIGIVSIRVRLTDKLLQYGGHIGYGINPKYFRKGYGTETLRLALEKAKDLISDKAFLITCDDDNIGSYKIIEANGGILENKIENEDKGERFLTRRYWIKK